MNEKLVTVGIADCNVVKGTGKLVTYALGSCVGICLYDANSRVAGLAHIMLPDSKALSQNTQTKKFADTCIVELVKMMEQIGAKKLFMKAKIAGGAQMFAVKSDSQIANIGARNVEAVKKTLASLSIPIIAEDTGLNYGRTQYFDVETGQMTIKSGLYGTKVF